jgi:hypothetical protein
MSYSTSPSPVYCVFICNKYCIMFFALKHTRMMTNRCHCMCVLCVTICLLWWCVCVCVYVPFESGLNILTMWHSNSHTQHNLLVQIERNTLRTTRETNQRYIHKLIMDRGVRISYYTPANNDEKSLHTANEVGQHPESLTTTSTPSSPQVTSPVAHSTATATVTATAAATSQYSSGQDSMHASELPSSQPLVRGYVYLCRPSLSLSLSLS